MKPWKQHLEGNLLLVEHFFKSGTCKKPACEVGNSWGWHEAGNLGSASRNLGNPSQQHQKSLTGIPGAFCMLNCEHRNNRAEQWKASLASNPKWRSSQARGDPCRPWEGHRAASSGLSFCSALCLAGHCIHHPPQQPTLMVFLSLKFACMMSMCRKIWHSYIQSLPKCVPCSSLCFSQHNHLNLIFHN